MKRVSYASVAAVFGKGIKSKIRRKHQQDSCLTLVCASVGNHFMILPANYVHQNKTGLFDLNETLITPMETVRCRCRGDQGAEVKASRCLQNNKEAETQVIKLPVIKLLLWFFLILFLFFCLYIALARMILPQATASSLIFIKTCEGLSEMVHHLICSWGNDKNKTSGVC